MHTYKRSKEPQQTRQESIYTTHTHTTKPKETKTHFANAKTSIELSSVESGYGVPWKIGQGKELTGCLELIAAEAESGINLEGEFCGCNLESDGSREKRE